MSGWLIGSVERLIGSVERLIESERSELVEKPKSRVETCVSC